MENKAPFLIINRNICEHLVTLFMCKKRTNEAG